MNSLTCGIIVKIYRSPLTTHTRWLNHVIQIKSELLYLMMMVSKDDNIIRPVEPTGRILMEKMDTVDKIKF